DRLEVALLRVLERDVQGSSLVSRTLLVKSCLNAVVVRAALQVVRPGVVVAALVGVDATENGLRLMLGELLVELHQRSGIRSHYIALLLRLRMGTTRCTSWSLRCWSSLSSM